VYARARPAGALAAGISTYSFPSGHSTTAAAVVVTVVYVLWRERLLARDLALGIGILVPLLIGVSRVYLDVHWATDVLGGWAVGIFIFGLCASAYERERRRNERAAVRQAAAVVD
jgi:undecaprenyl-diphosphatase